MPEKFTLARQFAKPELEKALLAAIAARPELYWELLDLLPAEALTTETRATFESLAEAIEQERSLPVIEGEPTKDPIAVARELAGLYQKRLLADLAQTFLDSLRGETQAADLIAQIEESLTRVQQAVRELRAGQIISLPDLLPEVLRDVQARRQAVKEQGSAAVGLPTGIDRLDKIMGGLQSGLHLLAAEPGQGKTTFVLQVAANISQSGFPVVFVSFEEALSRLALKVICASAGLEAKKFADGYGDPEIFEQAAREHGPHLAALHLVEGTSRLTVPQIRAKALQVLNKHKAARCLVIVDYLQRWASGKRDFGDFRHVVSGLVSDLRELSLRLDSPVLVISSQNRPGQGSARLVSLKESGDLEYSADTALFLVESEERKKKVIAPSRAVDLVIEKNRYGDKGKVELIFRPDIGVFREEAKQR